MLEVQPRHWRFIQLQSEKRVNPSEYVEYHSRIIHVVVILKILFIPNKIVFWFESILKQLYVVLHILLIFFSRKNFHSHLTDQQTKNSYSALHRQGASITTNYMDFYRIYHRSQNNLLFEENRK